MSPNLSVVPASEVRVGDRVCATNKKTPLEVVSVQEQKFTTATNHYNIFLRNEKGYIDWLQVPLDGNVHRDESSV